MQNTITITGNLTKDPQVRYTNDGTAVCNLSVAVNKRTYNPATKQWDETLYGFYDVNVWREYATNVAASLRKGNRVIITGTLKQTQWTDQQGQNRTSYHIEAEELGPALRFMTITATPNQPKNHDPAPPPNQPNYQEPPVPF